MNECPRLPETPVFEIAGRSMEPTLCKGSVVWVDDDVSSVNPGDVVLIAGRCNWIVHRLVHRSAWRGAVHIYHRGDLEGGIGVTSGSAICGRVVAITEPERSPIPHLCDLPADFRRRFRWARNRCRIHSICNSAINYLGLDQIRWIRTLGQKAQKRLL